MTYVDGHVEAQGFAKGKNGNVLEDSTRFTSRNCWMQVARKYCVPYWKYGISAGFLKNYAKEGVIYPTN